MTTAPTRTPTVKPTDIVTTKHIVAIFKLGSIKAGHRKLCSFVMEIKDVPYTNPNTKTRRRFKNITVDELALFMEKSVDDVIKMIQQ